MPNSPPVQVLKTSFDARAFLGHAEAGKAIEKYAKNRNIFSQGDIADTYYFIQKGKVKITVLSEHGKEAVVGIFAAGQFFGEACLDRAELRTATNQAMEDCLITSIAKTAMLVVLEQQPKFSAFFMAHLLSRNSRIEDDLIDQLFNSSERRPARLLLLLADFGNEGGAAPIAVSLSQETLVEMIGTTEKLQPGPTAIYRICCAAWTTDRPSTNVRLLAPSSKRRAMSDSKNDSKFKLECLRLASDLKQLANDTLNPDLKAHCLRMAKQWSGECAG